MIECMLVAGRLCSSQDEFAFLLEIVGEQVAKTVDSGTSTIDDAARQSLISQIQVRRLVHCNRSFSSASAHNLELLLLQLQSVGLERRCLDQKSQTPVSKLDVAISSDSGCADQDMLPDYGDGFLAACLDAYDDDPEKVSSCSRFLTALRMISVDIASYLLKRS